MLSCYCAVRPPQPTVSIQNQETHSPKETSQIHREKANYRTTRAMSEVRKRTRGVLREEVAFTSLRDNIAPALHRAGPCSKSLPYWVVIPISILSPSQVSA